MRAGLLSQPQVIQRLNKQFVCTTLSRFELETFDESGSPLAKEVLKHFQKPLILVFLSPDGQFVTKLSSLSELNEVHPDTSRRPEAPQNATVKSDVNNARKFLDHVERFFPIRDKP